MTADPGLPVYRRRIDVTSVQVDPCHLQVTGHLRDTAPVPESQGGDGHATFTVHEMSLSLLIRTSDLVVEDATADMSTFPHAECPLIAPHYAVLRGLSITKGFSRELNERLGGAAGCSHLKEIARNIAPVVIQSMTISRTPHTRPVGTTHTDGTPTPTGPAVGSCHVWKEEGVAVRKLRAGWVPGTTERPVPPLSRFTADPADAPGA